MEKQEKPTTNTANHQHSQPLLPQLPTQLGQRVRAGWAQGGSIRMVQALGGAQ